MADYNQKSEDFKSRRRAISLKNYQKGRDKILEKLKERRRGQKGLEKPTETPSYPNKHFSQADIHKANRVALDEIPYSFQPHKKPKQS